MKYVTQLLLCILLLGCSKEPSNYSTKELYRVISTNKSEAYIVESYSTAGKITQVVVQFPDRTCGAGAAHAYETNMNLKISWLSENELEIINPSKTVLGLNASGTTLQCGKQFIHIKVRENTNA